MDQLGKVQKNQKQQPSEEVFVIELGEDESDYWEISKDD